MDDINPHVDNLQFRRLRLDGKRSIAADLSDDSCCGIYAYEFSDGNWYVGKSTDVRSRHQQHLHEYRHETPPRTMKSMLFAEVPTNDHDLLDRMETAAIHWFDEHGYSLINIAKTAMPRGKDTVSIAIEGTFGVEIPWEREKRPRCESAESTYVEGCFSETRERQYAKLIKNRLSDDLLECLAVFVDETIPSPNITACARWTATAYAAPRYNDLGEKLTVACCVSVGMIEALTVFDNKLDVDGFINIKVHEGTIPPWQESSLYHFAIFEGNYKSANNVTTVYFGSIRELEQLLSNETKLNSCYRLNAEMIRRGSNAYSRYSNGFLMNEILRRAKRRHSQETN